MTTYYYECLCGYRSPKASSRDAMQRHRSDHRTICQRHQKSSRSNMQVTLALADAALARASEFKKRPVVPVHHGEGTGWKNTAYNAWGAPRSGGGIKLATTWTGGNCLKACIATILGADINKVPDPSRDFTPDGWLDRYDKRLQKATGHRLEKLPASLCPPRNQGQLWIATIREDGPDDHCVVARGNFIVHDPADLYQGVLPPKDRLVDGLLVKPTTRVVPDMHPQRNGWQIVPA